MPDWFNTHAPGSGAPSTAAPRQRGAMGQLWDLVTTPLPGIKAIPEAMHGMSEALTEHTIGESPAWAKVRGFLAGALGGTQAEGVPEFFQSGVAGQIPTSAGGIALASSMRTSTMTSITSPPGSTAPGSWARTRRA